jgi:hypothetical protein
MTWTGFDCKECGCGMTIGIYYGDWEDDETELDIEVTCGHCIREMRKTAAEKEASLKSVGANTQSKPIWLCFASD